MRKILFWATRGFCLLFVLFLLASLWLSQSWVRGAVEFKRSGAIELARILMRDYKVQASHIQGYAGERKTGQKYLFFTSSGSEPDFGTVNFFYGKGLRKVAKNLTKSKGDANKPEKLVVLNDRHAIVWRTYADAPACCKQKGAYHVIDREAAKVIVGGMNAPRPPRKGPSDLTVMHGLASTNISGFHVATEIREKTQSLDFLAAPGRFVHVPFLAAAPDAYTDTFAKAGTVVAVIAILLLGFYFFKKKPPERKQGEILEETMIDAGAAVELPN